MTETATTSRPVTVRARIRAALVDTPDQTIEQISQATGLRPRVVRSALDDVNEARHDGGRPWTTRRWRLWRT